MEQQLLPLLGSFYRRMSPTAKAALEDVFTGMRVRAVDIAFYANQIRFARALYKADILPLRRVSWYPIDVAAGETMVAIDNTLIEISSLQDRVHEPAAEYSPVDDFEIIVLADGSRQIQFLEPLPARAGDLATGYQLWGSKTYWWCRELMRLPGAFCPELAQDRTQVVRWIHQLEALYYSLLLSSSQQSVDLALSALLGSPVADAAGSVAIDGQRLTLTSEGDGKQYSYQLPSDNVAWTPMDGNSVARWDRLTTSFPALPAPYLSGWTHWRAVYLWFSEGHDRSTLEISPMYFNNDPESVRVLDEHGSPLEFQFRPGNGNLLIDIPPNQPPGTRTYIALYYDKDGASGTPEEEFVEYDLIPATDVNISEEKDVSEWHPCDSCAEILVQKSLLEMLLQSGYRELLSQLGKAHEKYLICYTD